MDILVCTVPPAVPPSPGAPPASYPSSRFRSPTSRLSPSYRSRSPTNRLSPSYRSRSPTSRLSPSYWSRSHFSQRSSPQPQSLISQLSSLRPQSLICTDMRRGQRHDTVFFCKTCTYHPPLHPTVCFERYYELRAYAVRY